MSNHRFMQIDVFTHRVGFGNALAVVFDADDMDIESMQRFAAWTNLSESVFLLQPDDARADYRVRIFTPRAELPFAGHPSVGSAFAALHAGIVTARDGTLVQQCAAGLLPVRVEANASNRIHVRSPRARMRGLHAEERALIVGLLPGASRARVDASRIVDNGPLWLIVPFATAESVRGWRPDMGAVAQVCAVSACVGMAVYADAQASDHARVVRAFCPNDGIAEDPVTGSANAAIAAVEHERIAARARAPVVVSQGRELGRDGFVHVEVDDDDDVWIGGHCVIAISGSVDWPAATIDGI